MKELAIVILDWNGAEDTIECLACLNNRALYDIYLLDNGSENENIHRVTYFLKKNFPTAELMISKANDFGGGNTFINYVLSDENLGFALGNNFIVNHIHSKYNYILLLNNDTVVPKGTIEHMLDTAQKQSTVALTCDIRYYDNKDHLWNAGGNFAFYGDRKYFSQRKVDGLKKNGIGYIDAEFITGCALLIRTDYVRINGLFTDKFFHGEEDFNFCYRLKQNRCKVGVDLDVLLYHKVGRSISKVVSTDRSLNKMLVHYSNRVIDFKDFYGKTKWNFWRALYLFMIFIRRLTSGLSYKHSYLLIKRIKDISDKYNDLKKCLFDEIMLFSWK